MDQHCMSPERWKNSLIQPSACPIRVFQPFPEGHEHGEITLLSKFIFRFEWLNELFQYHFGELP